MSEIENKTTQKYVEQNDQHDTTEITKSKNTDMSKTTKMKTAYNSIKIK